MPGLICNFSYSRYGFEDGIWVLIAPVPGHCILVTLLASNDRKAFFTSSDHRGYRFWPCQNVCDVFSYLFDNFYIVGHYIW